MTRFNPRVEIYLLRHGETEWNKEGRLQGQKDSLLTARGHEQAHHLGRTLRSRLGPRPLSMHVSPLGRARETAAILGKYMSVAKPCVEPRLQEMSLGAWEGLTRGEVNARWNGVIGRDSNAEWWFLAPGGESYGHFVERVQSWLAEQSGTIIAVSHGITTRMIRGEYLGLSRKERLSLPVPHGVIWRLADGAVETIQE